MKINSLIHSGEIQCISFFQGYPFCSEKGREINLLSISSVADISDLQSLSSGHGLAALCRCRDRL